MKSKQSLRQQIVQDLDQVFELALSVKNCSAAVRAKEVIGKIMGLFSHASHQKDSALAELDDKTLESLLKELNERRKD